MLNYIIINIHICYVFYLLYQAVIKQIEFEVGYTFLIIEIQTFSRLLLIVSYKLTER